MEDVLGGNHRELPLPPHANLMSLYGSGYLRTRAGVRLLAVYGKFKEKTTQVYLLRSGDDGQTWQAIHMPSPTEIAESLPGLNEPALVETDDGTIVAMMRPDPDTIGYLYESQSKDGGLTWTVPQRTSVWGYPANLIAEHGKVICTYGYRKAPMGIRASVFTNNFLIPSGKEIILRNDAVGRSSDVGYPKTVSLGNDRFFTVYYITTGDMITSIEGTKWTLASKR